MKRVHATHIGGGIAGTLLTYAVAPPDDHLLKVGLLRVDPSLAVIAAFAFLAGWGLAMSLRHSTVFQARLGATGLTRR